MSTYVSDQEMGRIERNDGSWMDVASDAMVAMDVRLLVDEVTDASSRGHVEAEIHLTPDEADRVAGALKRAATRVRAAT